MEAQGRHNKQPWFHLADASLEANSADETGKSWEPKRDIVFLSTLSSEARNLPAAETASPNTIIGGLNETNRNPPQSDKQTNNHQICGCGRR